MLKMLLSTPFQIVGNGCQIWLGLYFLGLAPGSVNTGSIISNVFGVVFLLSGVVSLGTLAKKRWPRSELPESDRS